MEKKQPTMRKILKFLLANTRVEFTTKDIAKGLNLTGISWHTSRLKAFIMDNKDAPDILQVRMAKGRESVFMCKVKFVDYPEEWASRLYNDYLEWERKEKSEEKKPNALTKPKDKEEVSVPMSFVYNKEEPIEIPINIKLTISVKVATQS